MTRHVTPPQTSEQTTDSTPDGGRFRIYRLCTCDVCGGTGKTPIPPHNTASPKYLEYAGGRCKNCRGEGKTLDLVATATDPESLGVALVTLGREGEFDGCPVGILDRPHGQTGVWLVKPWRPSARNLSDAGRALAHHRHHSDIV